MQADCLGQEGLADTGLPDQQYWPSFVQPLQAIELFDLRFADRAAGGEVDVFKRGSQRKSGGLDPVSGLALLTIVGLGLQQRVEELRVSGLISGSVSDGL